MSTAFLFPGQAAQFVGMGQDLYEAAEDAREVFDQAEEISGLEIRKLCFEGPEESLKQTSITQLAVFTHSVAAWVLLRKQGFEADVVAGHSVGELVALVAAEVISLEKGLRLVTARGRAMEAAGKLRLGTMAAIIGMDDPDVATLCQDCANRGAVTPANFNCPGQVVISGEVDAVHEAMVLAPSRGAKRVMELPVSGAFHTELMEPASQPMADLLREFEFSTAAIPVIPNVNAEPTTDPERLKCLLVEQVVSPVRWTESMQRLIADGVSRAFEVGPGQTLRGLMRRIDRELPVTPAGTLEDFEALSP